MRAHHKHFTPPRPLPLFEPPSLTSCAKCGTEALGRLDAPEEHSLGCRFTPPAQPVDTSREAASRIQGHTNRIRAAIYLWIQRQGERGATAGEIEATLGLKGSTVRPRLRELEGTAPWALELAYRIVKTPQKRDGMRVYIAR